MEDCSLLSSVSSLTSLRLAESASFELISSQREMIGFSLSSSISKICSFGFCARFCVLRKEMKYYKIVKLRT